MYTMLLCKMHTPKAGRISAGNTMSYAHSVHPKKTTPELMVFEKILRFVQYQIGYVICAVYFSKFWSVDTLIIQAMLCDTGN